MVQAHLDGFVTPTMMSVDCGEFKSETLKLPAKAAGIFTV
jgi:hypothetical protein